MQLVIDANILFAALIARKKSLDIILRPNIEVAAPEFIKQEWKEHQEEIAKKAGLSYDEAMAFFIILTEKVRFYTPEEIKQEMEEIKDTIKDADDIEYLALALKLNCPLWSEDKDLKEQSVVKVINTKELLERIS